jgi:hypothetical protein
MKAALALILSIAFLAIHAISQTPAQLKQELRTKETAAKKDPDALFEVGKWAGEKGLAVEAKRIFQAVLKIKPDHEGANLGVGNVQFEGKWWPAKEAAALQKKAQAAEYAAKGMVDVGGVWVEKEQVDDAKRGVFHHENQRVTREEKLALLEGKVRHPDTDELIDPKFLEKAQSHYYPVGGEGRWVDEKEADTYHSDVKRPWIIRSSHCTLVSTLPLQKLLPLKQMADRGVDLAGRLLNGAEPTPANRPLLVIAATDTEYREWGTAVGDGTDAASAFLMSDQASMKVPFQGEVRAAICVWHKDWGPYNVRHGAALAYLHGLCADAGADVPLWVQHGFGSYASRFESDRDAGWFGKQHVQKGGVRNLKAFFASFAINGEMESKDIDYNLYQAGLMFSFAAHGGDAAVTDAMVAVTTALSDPKKGGVDKAITKLTNLLIASEEKIVAYLQKLVAKSPQ